MNVVCGCFLCINTTKKKVILIHTITVGFKIFVIRLWFYWSSQLLWRFTRCLFMEWTVQQQQAHRNDHNNLLWFIE